MYGEFSYYVFFCVFFFFKQKTAYEMRISDWSSDVCSSDLRRRCRAGSARKAAEFRPVLGHGRTGAPDDREPAASGNDRMRPALFQDQAFAYAVIGGSPSTARLRSCTMPSSVIGRGLG